MNGDDGQQPLDVNFAKDNAANAPSKEFVKYPGEALTRIRETYTLSPTQKTGEVDDLMIKQFLNTLADVAMTVATRKINRQDSHEGMSR